MYTIDSSPDTLANARASWSRVVTFFLDCAKRGESVVLGYTNEHGEKSVRLIKPTSFAYVGRDLGFWAFDIVAGHPKQFKFRNVTELNRGHELPASDEDKAISAFRTILEPLKLDLSAYTFEVDTEQSDHFSIVLNAYTEATPYYFSGWVPRKNLSPDTRVNNLQLYYQER